MAAMGIRETKDHAAIEAEQARIEREFQLKVLNEKLKREGYKVIAAQARKEKLWIFDPVDKSWYNPDELEATFQWYLTGAAEIMQRVVLKDPFISIETAHKRLSEFTKRVLDYERRDKEIITKKR
jgi:hypothetical protein